jgi:hypothetical protein
MQIALVDGVLRDPQRADGAAVPDDWWMIADKEAEPAFLAYFRASLKIVARFHSPHGALACQQLGSTVLRVRAKWQTRKIFPVFDFI